MAEEDSKFGLSLEEVVSLIEAVSKLPNVRVQGLMTVASFCKKILKENRRNLS